MSTVDIAIIGGGLVGASLALALQAEAKQRGWKLALIEPFAPGDSFQPSYDGRASALTYGSRLIYERLGIWPQVASRAEPILDIHVSDQGHFGSTRLSAKDESVPALGYVVENAWLGHCLWNALDDEVVQWHCPAKVSSMSAIANGYLLQLADGAELKCQLAILADGGRSNLREQLGVEVKLNPYGQTAVLANVTPERAHNGLAFERFTALGPMALLPMLENRCVLIWSRPPEQAQRLLELPEREFLAELQDCFGYRLGEFLQVGTRYQYELCLSQSAEQVRSNLVVLGNAAHGMHPIAGQGYNLSLRDTISLAEHLIASRAPLGDLATLLNYQASQQKDQLVTIGFSDQATRFFSNNKTALVGGRNLGLLALDLLPPCKSVFAGLAMGLGSRPVTMQENS